MFHPAESSEQQVDTYEMLVKSPTYNIEDKIQERFDKEFYKDVRYPSTLQSRPPSVASSVFPTERANQRCYCACAAAASTTFSSAAFYYRCSSSDGSQLCVSSRSCCTPPPTRLKMRSWWTRSRPRR